jgi:hypothetical protein
MVRLKASADARNTQIHIEHTGGVALTKPFDNIAEIEALGLIRPSQKQMPDQENE